MDHNPRTPAAGQEEGNTTMQPYYQHNGITIYHADARDVLPSLNRVAAVITDIPYGVDLGVNKDMRQGQHGLGKKAYASYEDTYENYCTVIVPALRMALDRADRGAVFVGPHIQELPKATAIGGVYCPAGAGRHQWGFKTFLPVLFYGTDPELHKGARPNVITSTAQAERSEHPCPKPLPWMRWLVARVTRADEDVLDPFMGVGTTLVAAKELGRRAIGIELEERYCDLAARRLSQEVMELAYA